MDMHIAMDIAVSRLRVLHLTLYDDAGSVVAQMAVWLSFMAVVVLACAWFTMSYAPTAIGSGVPQIEVLLSGIRIHKLLSMRTLMVKLFGLTLTLGSGVFAGKKGEPMGCCVVESVSVLCYLRAHMHMIAFFARCTLFPLLSFHSLLWPPFASPSYPVSLSFSL